MPPPMPPPPPLPTDGPPKVEKFTQIQRGFYGDSPQIFLGKKISRELETIAGWRDARAVHIECIDILRKVRSGNFTTPPKATFTMPPSVTLLLDVVKATTTSLKMAIEEYKKRDENNPGDGNQRNNFSVEATLLHGKKCSLWNKNEQLAIGQLGFKAFAQFGIKGEDGKWRTFELFPEDFMSGMYALKDETE